MFEHFGSLKSAVHSAGDGRPGNSLLDVEGGDKRMAVDPQYTIPKVRCSRFGASLLGPVTRLRRRSAEGIVRIGGPAAHHPQGVVLRGLGHRVAAGSYHTTQKSQY